MSYLKYVKKKIRFFISPYFLPRFYLLNDIKYILKKYKFAGNILDFGCGGKPYKYLFKDAKKYEGIDFINYSINKDFYSEKPDFYFSDDYLDNFNLPFNDNIFDNVVSFQVLEHHKNPQKMIREIFRVTKKGGYVLVSVPFLEGIHEVPNDYQRFTQYGLVELFNKYDCEILEVRGQGSLFSTISLLINEYLNHFASRSKTRYYFSVLIYPPFLFFQYLSLVFDKIFKSDKFCFNYLVLARKKD